MKIEPVDLFWESVKASFKEHFTQDMDEGSLTSLMLRNHHSKV